MIDEPSTPMPEISIRGPLEKDAVLDRRESRVKYARSLLREALEVLSVQVNDEEAIGGALDGIRDAEAATRSAMRCLHGLDTSRDVRRS